MSATFSFLELPRGLLVEHLQRLERNLHRLSGRLRESIAIQVSDAVAGLVRQGMQALLEDRPLTRTSLTSCRSSSSSSALEQDDQMLEEQEGLLDDPWPARGPQEDLDEPLEPVRGSSPAPSSWPGWLQVLAWMCQALRCSLPRLAEGSLAVLHRWLPRTRPFRPGLLAAALGVLLAVLSLLSVSGTAQVTGTVLAGAVRP